MANYVKFLRGTPAAYERLVANEGTNSDTLYFIYEKDESTGVLYLGSKLIAGSVGGNSANSVTKLSELKDVLISNNLVADSVLIYDKNASAWVNRPVDDFLFVGATSESSGVAGLVPAPKANELDLFLKSDGTWAKPSVNHTILTLENVQNNDHSQLIIEATQNNAVSGDIVIVKDLLSENNWQYTAYVFNGAEWQAMDGNYNAENVYFSKDLITTTEIGNIKLDGGQATISAAGKNLKEVFETIFVQEKNPTTTLPSVSLVFSNSKAYEVGTMIAPTYSATFNSGKYSYDDATGVTVTGWEITNSDDDTLTTNKGSFGLITVTDDTKYYVTATANYSNGIIPSTNLGNEYSAGQILAHSTSITKGPLTGYRKTFYGTLDDKELEFDSYTFRNYLDSTTAGSVNGDNVLVNIPIGA